jgi:hypothetical protein
MHLKQEFPFYNYTLRFYPLGKALLEQRRHQTVSTVQDTCSYCTQYGDTDNETMRQSSDPTNIEANLYAITIAAGFDPTQKLARLIRWSARCWFFVYKQFTSLHNTYHVPDLLLLTHALQLRTPLAMLSNSVAKATEPPNPMTNAWLQYSSLGEKWERYVCHLKD